MNRAYLRAVLLSAFRLFCNRSSNIRRTTSYILVGNGAELEKTSMVMIGMDSGSSPCRLSMTGLSGVLSVKPPSQ
jgi:hypothetical protein